MKTMDRRAEAIETVRHITHRLKNAGIEDFIPEQAIVIIYNDAIDDAFNASQKSECKNLILSTDVDWSKDYPNWEDLDGDTDLADLGDLYNGSLPILLSSIRRIEAEIGELKELLGKKEDEEEIPNDVIDNIKKIGIRR